MKTVLLVACLALVVVGASRTSPTLAAWTDSLNVTGSSFTAYTVPAAVAACSASTTAPANNTQHVIYTLNGVTTPATDYASVVSGWGTAGTSTWSGTGTSSPSLDIAYDSSKANNKNVVLTVTFSTQLTNATTWTGPESLGEFRTSATSKVGATCGDPDPPTNVAFAAPDGTSRTVAVAMAYATTTCTSAAVIMCGTYTEANPATVEYTLKRVNGATTKCWNGNWGNPPRSGICPTQTGSTINVSGNNQAWYVTGNQANMYPITGGTGTFTLVLTITDVTDNTTTSTLTFTMT